MHASWLGNDNYEGAISPPISFMVEKPPLLLPPVTTSTTSPQPMLSFQPAPQVPPIGLVITLVVFAGIAVAILARRRRGKARHM